MAAAQHGAKLSLFGFVQDHPAIVCSNALKEDKSPECLTDQIYKVRCPPHAPLSLFLRYPRVCAEQGRVVAHLALCSHDRARQACTRQHTSLRLCYKTGGVASAQIGSTKIRKRALLAYALFKKGPLTTTGCDHGAFINTLGAGTAQIQVEASFLAAARQLSSGASIAALLRHARPEACRGARALSVALSLALSVAESISPRASCFSAVHSTTAGLLRFCRRGPAGPAGALRAGKRAGPRRRGQLCAVRPARQAGPQVPLRLHLPGENPAAS